MKVLILCGGQGTRLREETEFRPKPMVEIGGKPILWHIMKRYVKYGFNDFVLLLGYKGNMIKDYFLNYRAMTSDFAIECGNCDEGIRFYNGDNAHFSVTLVDTGLDTPTGGRIKRAAKYLGEDDTFMVTYGDGLADIDINNLMAFHLAHGKLATISITKSTSRFGVVKITPRGDVREFTEKPMGGLINMGFMIFNRQAMDYIQDNEYLEGEPMQRLVQDGQLMAYQHLGFFQQMDTYHEYLKLNELWNSGKAEWAQ